MILYCLLIFHLTFTVIISSSSPIVLKLKETDQRTYTTNICMGGGDSLNCNDLHVALIENEISVYKNCRYRPSLSSSSKFISDLSSPSALYTDTVILIDPLTNETTSFETYIEEIFIKNNKKNGFFGLGRAKDNNNELSLINQLYRIANHKKAFYIDTKHKELIIGTYPSIANTRKIKFINFNSNNNEKKYVSKVDSAFFKGSNNEYLRYEINSMFEFCLSNSGIQVPKDFALFVFDNYLGHVIRNNTCKVVNNDGFLFVRCGWYYKYESDDNLNDITFIFDNKVSMRLSWENLFTKFDSEVYFLIVYNPHIDSFSFGYPFFNRYVMLVDEDRKQIGFYAHRD